MPASERPNELPPGQAPPGEWAERLQQQWDAVLASLGDGRSAEDLRAMMQLFLESQRLIAASVSSYFAALSGRPVADPVIEERLGEIERRLAAVERALESSGRAAAPRGTAGAASTPARAGAPPDAARPGAA